MPTGGKLTPTLEPAPPSVLAADLHAFFLDVDGTLLEFAPRPDMVSADAPLISLLHALFARAAGAVALVSGRTVEDLDRVMQPHRFPVSGIHGLERRSAALGFARTPFADPHNLSGARDVLQHLVSEHPQLLLEDKGISLALHYRAAPALRDTIEGALAAIPALAMGELRVQHGHLVTEILLAGATKATALAAFMDEEPFRGRRPVYLGDDLTDECAFEWVNERGGLSIAVAARRPSAASARLASVQAARAWLVSICAGAT
jgi:trehalose 6-phosphate phosphatase